jgi:DNA-binding response OmpR family regulator
MSKILVIDDDRELLILIQEILESQDYVVTICEGPQKVAKNTLGYYDLILLDIMMPGMDGFQYCEEIRSLVDCPILFITAKNSEADLVKGLNLGADDYIQKPFGIAELRARVQAHLRREHRVKKNAFFSGGIHFFMQSKEAYVNDNPLCLTKSEYVICEYLALHPGQTFSREQIFEAVFGFEKDSYDNVIVEHIKNIRSKLIHYKLMPIETVWGIGYKWNKKEKNQSGRY